MHVIGTAGHVDHGKSSLVRALTGTNPDRWAEEQRRGMTLDLGFAHLRFPDGLEAGIVDVPGHERFLHNMLAGAAGMEALLLVVSATEGPRPQTFEHLAIASFLNVRRTIVVLTKADLAGDEELAFAEDLTREALAGSVAAGAPTIAVSSRTGAGLDRLRDEIRRTLAALPPRAPLAPAYLPIDRVFTLPGHGTVVTGTLMQGRIAAGETLLLSPLGREVRARTLQVFGERRADADGGTRVAINLPGVESDEIGRGAVLADPRLPVATTIPVRFRPLPEARALLKRRTAVRLSLGSAEILATLTLGAAPAEDDAREAFEGRLTLREPAVAIPGATFVVRRLSPKTLLGGGEITAASAIGAAAADEAPEAALAPEARLVLGALGAGGDDGLSLERLAAAANLVVERAASLAEELVQAGLALRLARPAAYVDAARAEATFGRARAVLATGEAERPWGAGTTSLALSRALGVKEGLLVRLLAPFVDDGRLVYRGGYYATPLYEPRLTAAQERLFAEIFVDAPERATLTPVPLASVLAAVKRPEVDGAAAAFESLVARGALVKVGADVYRGAQMVEIRTRLEHALRERGRISPAEVRDTLGSSRKFVVPLLEYLDAIGFTLRTGDDRVLREPAAILTR